METTKGCLPTERRKANSLSYIHIQTEPSPANVILLLFQLDTISLALTRKRKARLIMSPLQALDLIQYTPSINALRFWWLFLVTLAVIFGVNLTGTYILVAEMTHMSDTEMQSSIKICHGRDRVARGTNRGSMMSSSRHQAVQNVLCPKCMTKENSFHWYLSRLDGGVFDCH